MNFGALAAATVGYHGSDLEVNGRPVGEFLQDLVSNGLAAHAVIAAIAGILVGLVFLLYGYRIYKPLVILAWAVVGLFVGSAVAAYFNFNPLIGIIGGAVILGLLAWPLDWMAWCILGGLLAGLPAAAMAIACGLQGWLPVAAIGGGAFLVGVVLIILFRRPLIIIITSLFGAELIVAGVLGLTALEPSVRDPVMAMFSARPYLLAVLVVLAALVGIILQFADPAARAGARARKSRKAEGASG